MNRVLPRSKCRSNYGPFIHQTTCCLNENKRFEAEHFPNAVNMDSHVGLDYIVDNPDYCVKLASALDTACPSVKKQVVELLSALCVYSQDGRQRAIDTLHAYQKRKNERYRLRIVVEELQNATGEDYRTALLAFINCLVISTPVLKDRIRIRNEFIGLKLLPILNELR